jgi:hypothetical protein
MLGGFAAGQLGQRLTIARKSVELIMSWQHTLKPFQTSICHAAQDILSLKSGISRNAEKKSRY